MLPVVLTTPANAAFTEKPGKMSRHLGSVTFLPPKDENVFRGVDENVLQTKKKTTAGRRHPRVLLVTAAFLSPLAASRRTLTMLNVAGTNAGQTQNPVFSQSSLWCPLQATRNACGLPLGILIPGTFRASGFHQGDTLTRTPPTCRSGGGEGGRRAILGIPHTSCLHRSAGTLLIAWKRREW